jgi:hypothetical protein
MSSEKSLLEVKDLAKQKAIAKGHEIKRWSRSRPYRYTARCAKCGADLAVYSRCIDSPAELPFNDHAMIRARDKELYWTKRDYNWAIGTMLSEVCGRS